MDLEVPRSIRGGSTIFSTIKQRLNNAPSFSAGGIFCVFWPIYPNIYPNIYSCDSQIMLDKNDKLSSLTGFSGNITRIGRGHWLVEVDYRLAIVLFYAPLTCGKRGFNMLAVLVIDWRHL